ncbi:MAG TPA: CoA pyrophosphatase [Polyangiaceae bacterium]|nr:CoA pyrophosphatase [Polyangiaceae bacterium]
MAAWHSLDRQHLRTALAVPAPRHVARGTRRAAVALVLHERSGGVQLLLIRRAHRVGDPWSGQMALPGGHWQTEDPDLHHTALRETAEEIGLDLRRHAELLGQLDELTPANAVDVVVRPFVFALNATPVFTQSSEVDAVVWVDLADLVSGQLLTRHEVAVRDQRVRFPAWQLGEHVVWGLTYRVLTTLLLRAGTPTQALEAELGP